MIIPPKVRRVWYMLRAFAITLIIFAIVIFLLWPNIFGFRLLGLLMILISVWVVRISNTYVRRAQGQVEDDKSQNKTARRVGLLGWLLAAGSFIACAAFYLVMYVDALHGGKEGWPAYAFGCAALALAVTGSYVIMKLFQ